MVNASNSQYFSLLGQNKVRDCTLNPNALSTHLNEATGKLSMSFGDRIKVTFYQLLSILGVNTADKIQSIVWNYFNDALNANDYAGREVLGSIEPSRVASGPTCLSQETSPTSIVRAAYLPETSSSAKSSVNELGLSVVEDSGELPADEEIAFEKQQRRILDEALGNPRAPDVAPSLDIPTNLPGLAGLAYSQEPGAYADILPDLPGLST